MRKSLGEARSAHHWRNSTVGRARAATMSPLSGRRSAIANSVHDAPETQDADSVHETPGTLYAKSVHETLEKPYANSVHETPNTEFKILNQPNSISEATELNLEAIELTSCRAPNSTQIHEPGSETACACGASAP